MTKLLAFSGRKQSGKDTSFNLILGIELLKLSVVRNNMAITNDGKLWISDIFGDSDYEGIFDVDRDTDTMRDFLSEFVYPYVKKYSFMDKLKQDICINILGLDRKSVYGTENEKNMPTHITWDKLKFLDPNLKSDKSGPMSGREVMQIVGSVFTSINNNIWSDLCIKTIQKEDPILSVIVDCRLPHEVDAIHKAGGMIIRLTRNIDEDSHKTERALDQDNYDWGNFDAIIDNQNMTISEQNAAILQVLAQWEYIDKVNNNKIKV